MKTYDKIKTLFRFDKDKKRFIYGDFYDKNVELLAHHGWVFTEKIDGTNFRINWNGYDLSYAGRTEKSQFSKQQKHFIEDVLLNDLDIEMEQVFENKDVIIFGELYGKNIQGNLGYSDDYNFIVFDIMIDGVYLKRNDVEEICDKFKMDIVPIIFVDDIYNAIEFVKEEKQSTIGNAKMEGLVGKPIGDFCDRLGDRIMVKIKYRDLLKTIKE